MVDHEKQTTCNQVSQDYQVVASYLFNVEENRLGQLNPLINYVDRQREIDIQNACDRWFGFHISDVSSYLHNVRYQKNVELSQKNQLNLSQQNIPNESINVKIEALEYRKQTGQSRGLNIVYGIHPTRFGEALIALSGGGICAVFFTSGRGSAEEILELHQRWPEATFTESKKATYHFFQHLFQVYYGTTTIPLSLVLMGTEFQIQVWRGLLQIPFGEVTTYENLARYLERPKSTRAVASAIAKNPISLLIPCHRVFRKDKSYGGYRWGIERKIAMLAWEFGQKQKNPN